MPNACARSAIRSCTRAKPPVGPNFASVTSARAGLTWISVIRHLEQFGPQFFELTQFTRIPPEAYRAIASHVTAEGVHLDGEVIPLRQENSLRIAGAVVELRKRSRSAKEHSAAAPEARFPAVEKRFADLIARLAALRLPLSTAQEKALARMVLRLLERASAAGVQLHLR